MAQIAGPIIVSMIVSSAVSQLGPKLGLSESTSDLLGMGAGIYAGGMVGGGSTDATMQQVGSTSSQVGAEIPAGYGGVPEPHAAGAGVAPAVPPPAINPAVSRGALSTAMQSQPTPLQAPTTPQAGGELVGKVGGSTPESAGTARTEQGLLKQGAGQTSAPDTATMNAGKPDTAQMVKERELVKKIDKKDEGTNWWKQLFTPEKTMDMAMAAMQGYAEAGMAEEDRKYPEKIAKQNAKDWASAYGTNPASLNQTYPSGYKGP